MEEDLTCPLTLDLLEDPVALPCCGKSSSRLALVAALTRDTRCPCCRQDIAGFDVQHAPPNRVIQAVVDEYKRAHVVLPGHHWSAKAKRFQGEVEVELSIEKARFLHSQSLFVAIVDQSGSMGGEPWAQVQQALVHILSMASSSPSTQVEIICFQSAATRLPTLPLPEMIARVCREGAGGGTCFLPAFTELGSILDRAAQPNVTVVLMTDGQGEARADVLNPRLDAILARAGKRIIMHTVGFGAGCDQPLLEALRSVDGTFRYATPGDSTDALCQKITQIFTISNQGSLSRLQVSVDDHKWSGDIAVDERRRGMVRFWLPALEAKEVMIRSDCDPDARVPIEFMDADDDIHLRFAQIKTDQLAAEVLQAAQEHNVSKDLRMLQCGLFRRRTELLQDIADDARLPVLLEQIKSLRAGQQVDVSRLSDMRFGSLFGESVKKAPTEVPRALPPRAVAVVPRQPQPLLQSENQPYYADVVASRNAVAQRIWSTLLNPYCCIDDASWDDLAQCDADGNTALHLAAYRGQFRTLEAILAKFPQAKALINQSNHEEETTVTLAIKKRGYDKCLTILLAQGGDIPRKKAMEEFAMGRGYRRTAAIIGLFGDVSVAVETSMSKEMVRVKYERAVALQKPWDATQYLEVCLMNQDLELVEIALKHGGIPTIDWVVEYCMPPKPDHVDTAVYLDLLRVVLKAHPKLLGQGHGSNQDTLLIKAVEKGSLPHVQYLVVEQKMVVDVTNALGNTALWVAVMKRFPCMVDFLLDQNAHPNHANRKGNTALYNVTQRGPVKIAEKLLAAGAKVDTINGNGDNLLLLCCRNGQAEVLQLLLQHADPQLVHRRAHIDGFNCILSCAEQDRAECIEVLQQFGVNLEDRTAPDNAILKDATPLHLACYYGSVDAAQKLAQFGVDLNAVDAFGMTPLHIAVIRGHERLVRLLIQAGANTFKLDQNGNPPVVYARDKQELRDLLVDPLVASLCKLARKGFNEDDEKRAYVLLKACPSALDLQDENGASALTHAVLYSNVRAVCEFLELGAKNVRDKRGLSCDFWAHVIGVRRIADLFPHPLTDRLIGSDVKSLPHTTEQLRRVKDHPNRRLLFVGGNRSYTEPSQSSLAYRLGPFAPSSWQNVLTDGKLSEEVIDALDAKLFAVAYVATEAGDASVAEVLALNYFTSAAAVWLRGYTYDNAARNAYLRFINDALEKLPVYAGEVYTSCPERYAIGSEITFPSFVSASTLWPVVVDLVPTFPKKGTVVILHSKTGRLVSPFSTTPYDCEVVFRPGSRWRVVRWLRADLVALGQANIREHTFSVDTMPEDKGLIIEMEEL